MSPGLGHVRNALLGTLLLVGIASVTVGSLLLLRPELFKGGAEEGKCEKLCDAIKEIKNGLKKLDDALSRCNETSLTAPQENASGSTATTREPPEVNETKMYLTDTSTEPTSATGSTAATETTPSSRNSTLTPNPSVEATSAKLLTTTNESSPSSRNSTLTPRSSASAGSQQEKLSPAAIELNNQITKKNIDHKILLIVPLVLALLVAATIFMFRNKCKKIHKETVLPESGMENRLYGKTGDIILLGVTPCGPEGRDSFYCYIPDETPACEHLPSSSTD
ncbi:hypothetical protein GN956_G12228 [Arapaima gigas]